MVGSLLAVRDPDAETLLAEQQKLDPSGEGLKYAYVVDAGRPEAATKQKYFDEYLHQTARPEDWIEGSLGWFNHWKQEEFTLPYLKQALDALPQVKRERKIFFVLAWLNSFIGDSIPSSPAPVHDFLASACWIKTWNARCWKFLMIWTGRSKSARNTSKVQRSQHLKLIPEMAHYGSAPKKHLKNQPVLGHKSCIIGKVWLSTPSSFHFIMSRRA